MSARPSSRALHDAHADERNRVRAFERHEHAVRERTLQRLASVLAQSPEPHHFHMAIVVPVSPRRGWDWPDQPGGLSSDFEGAIA